MINRRVNLLDRTEYNGGVFYDTTDLDIIDFWSNHSSFLGHTWFGQIYKRLDTGRLR
jgi:hypothetical protein